MSNNKQCPLRKTSYESRFEKNRYIGIKEGDIENETVYLLDSVNITDINFEVFPLCTKDKCMAYHNGKCRMMKW